MLKLSSLFGNNAVFQRGISVPVWGWAEPNSLLECNFNGQSPRINARPDGVFMFRLAPMQYGGPYDLTVRNIRSGETVCSSNIMVGEVWLASGQSNMEMELCRTGDDASLAAADNPLVRMITVSRTTKFGGNIDANSDWKISTPETAGDFSAVGYYFASKISNELGAAVGIINSSWGGSIAETWTSRESLMQNDYSRNIVQNYESKLFETLTWEQDSAPDITSDVLMAARLGKLCTPETEGLKNGWAKPDLADDDWRVMTLPTGWVAAGEEYNGVLWFRLAVDIPADLAGRDWQLELGSVDKHDVTYFNGVQVGATGCGLETQYWNVPRKYDVPASLVKPGRNVIAVRAYSFMFEGGLIGPADAMKLSPKSNPDAAISLTGKWKFKTELNLGRGMVEQGNMAFGPGIHNSPYMLFDNMIRPLLPYAISGAIWYQGESNEHVWKHYRELMENLIRDWRHSWGQGDFPFYQVQLANFREPQEYQENSEWAYIREAQFQAGKTAGCDVAVIIDAGEAEDIHPHDKKTVGLRLASLALHQTYRKHDVVPCGPTYRSMTIEGSKIRLTFDHCEGSLMSNGGGFFIAGQYGKFVKASVAIEGDTVVVSSVEIENPVAVRYAWADNPLNADLQNGAGFPASPFRTDTWQN